MDLSSKLKREIFREYDRQPSGWQAYAAIDSRGYLNTVFVHGSDVWVLKEQVVNPYESVGFGVKTSLVKDTDRWVSPSFGLRPVSKDAFLGILKAGEGGSNLDQLIIDILKQEPQPVDKLRSPAVLQGPVVYSKMLPDILPDRHKELDLKLREELERLLNRRYPHLSTMYG